jgi:predicted thioesterase
MSARYLGPEGKHHRFEVVAHDDTGEIFRGQHVRAVVDAERLEKGAARRRRL